MITVETVEVNSLRFKELLLRAVKHYYLVEQDQKGIPELHAFTVWEQLAEDGHCVYLTDGAKELFCIYTAGLVSPHHLGEGVSVLAMLSTEFNYRLYKRLRKFLIAVTKEFDCTWLKMNHKIRTGVYELKYMRV